MKNNNMIYISTAIRGLSVTPENYGTPEADKIIDQNIEKAEEFARKLNYCLPFGYSAHNPAGRCIENFISLAYSKGVLTEKQILATDCELIERSAGVIFYNHQGEFSKGMLTEFQYTVEHGKPYVTINDSWYMHIEHGTYALIKQIESQKETV